jgi:Peptidase family M50/Clp amino terminal domain, pathogenicity island component
LIYSAKHRPSLGERALSLIAPTVSLLFTWWLVFTGLLALGPDANLALLVLGLAISLAVGVFIHEAGHLMVGLVLGTEMRKIRVGSGPTLFTFRPRGIRVQICTNPLGGGAVYLSGLDHSSNDVRIAISAAGPVTNLLAALYALVMVHAGFGWFGVFAVANLLLGVDNLIPHNFTLDGREQPTDGMQILKYVRGTAQASLYYEGAEVRRDAQTVLVRAVEEARDGGSAEVTDMHLLLGLAGDRDVRPLLGTLDLRGVMRAAAPTTGEDVIPSWAPVTNQVEQAAFRVARDLGMTKPDAACMCLALMAVDCPAGKLIKESGVSDTALRDLAASRPEPTLERDAAAMADLSLERWGAAADRIITLATRIALADRSAHTGTEHILAALMAEPTSRAARALDRLGFILVRDDRAVLKREASAGTRLSPQAAAAMVAALGRTGATYPMGTGELCLGIADQGSGMGAMLLNQAGIKIADLVKALRLIPRDPSEPLGCTLASHRLWELRASARLGAQRYLDSRADFMVMEQSAPTDAIRALDRNNIAWASLMSGDPTLWAEALELSRAAVGFEPERLAFKGTLAFALMENGSVTEAAALLEPVASNHPRPRDRALDLCLLAICNARLDDSEAAARNLRAAETVDPHCPLLERARAEITRSAALAIT